MTDSILDLLAPDAADAAGLEAVIKVARALVVNERPNAGDEQPSLAGADFEAEYLGEVRRAALGYCSRLFRLYLEGMSPVCGLEPWAQVRGGASESWVALLELEERRLGLALPSLPEPNEAGPMVAARLLGAAECLGLNAGACGLWRAHLTAADAGPLRGGEAYLAVLAIEGVRFGDLEQAHLGYLGCLLLRGAVARAVDWVETNMDVVAASPALMRLAGWVQLAAGDEEAAEEFLVGMPRASLPGPIVALGDRLERLREKLGGGSVWDPKEPAATTSWIGMRRGDLGAAVLCVVEMGDAGARVVHGEFAPGLEEPNQAWLERQEVVPFEVGVPEHGVMLGTGIFVGFPDRDGDVLARGLARGCISERCCAMALVPLCVVDGQRVAGWLRLEFEHLLVPSDERLLGFAQMAGRRLGLGVARPVPTPALACLARDLVIAAMKGFSMGRRRWWCLALRTGSAQVLCSEGTALGDWERVVGSRQLVDQCAGSGLPVLLESVGDGMHGAGHAGLAVPLPASQHGSHGRARFVLVVESNRLGDLGPKDLAGLLEGRRGDLRGLGSRLEAAAFGVEHERSFGESILLDVRGRVAAPGVLGLGGLSGSADREGLIGELGRLGAGPILIWGLIGTGKRTVARLRAFLRGGAAQERRARSLDKAGLRELLAYEAGVLRDVDELPGSLQSMLLEAMEAGRADGLVCTSRLDPEGLEGLGLWPRLGDYLKARSMRLASLAERRDELPGLFNLGLRRAARAQSCLVPSLTVDGEALVWRQAWDGGIHEVMELARRLVPLAHGREVNAQELASLAAELGWHLLPKLATRNFDKAALWQALDGTRKKSGAYHRSRAAMRLGWDPDTLGLRLAKLGL